MINKQGKLRFYTKIIEKIFKIFFLEYTWILILKTLSFFIENNKHFWDFIKFYNKTIKQIFIIMLKLNWKQMVYLNLNFCIMVMNDIKEKFTHRLFLSILFSKGKMHQLYRMLDVWKNVIIFNEQLNYISI